MKIVFCKTGFAGPISGADEIAVMYAVALKRAGHDTALLLVHQPANDDVLAARLRESGVPLTALASQTFSTSLATARKLAIRAMRTFKPASKLILHSRSLVFDLMQRYQDACCAWLARERPDVVHVLTPDQGAMMFIRAAHKSGIPVIYHEVGIPFHPPGFEQVYERFTSVLPLCAKVAVLSPRLASETSQALPNVAFPSVVPLISHEVSNGLNISPTPRPVRFGFAARLEYLKGPLQLVEAFRKVHATQPDIELRIAGEGSQRQEIVDTLRANGLESKYSFTGVYQTVAERNAFMQDIDVFVLPSLTEGTPNAIIEAMAHHKPIVATRVGGIPDLVSDEVGMLFPPGDVDSLSAALSTLAADAAMRVTMGEAARKRYEDLFTPRAVVPLLLDFYEGVTGRNGDRDYVAPAHPWSS
jgi:glycosyltransferase involved in cell wall biosynthesis